MKKITRFMITLVLGLSLIGCGQAENGVNTSDTNQSSETQKPADIKGDKPEVTIDDIKLVDFRLEKNGEYIDVKTKFKNKSKKKIKNVHYIYNMGPGKCNLSWSDVIEPGETSGEDRGDGPPTGNPNDLVLLFVNFDIVNADGTITAVSYDATMKIYSVY